MQIGYIGLGKMGAGMVARLSEKGHAVIATDPDASARAAAAKAGAQTVETVAALVDALDAPRTVWLMVPWRAVDAVLAELMPLLAEEDTVIDGGNSPYKESMRRHAELAARGIRFMDVGVSGGPHGARNGACVMVGGEREDYDRLAALWRDIAAPEAYGYMGRAGAGHFVKMVHNGIEYGMMQAIAEGFALMRRAPFDLDLTEVARIYNHESVIASRLTRWLEAAYRAHGEDLADISGEVAHSGEGLWTVEAARELGIPVRVIEDSLRFREASQGNPSYTGKVVSALRHQFGGHDVMPRS